jgi:c-di-GMP-binding flagellar brake protein YcgR
MTESRRLHERFDVELPVLVVHEGAEVSGTTVNVSLGGMLLQVERPVPFGANVRIRVELPALKDRTEIPAVVRWDRDGAIGVQFTGLRARDTWALNQLMKAR